MSRSQDQCGATTVCATFRPTLPCSFISDTFFLWLVSWPTEKKASDRGSQPVSRHSVATSRVGNCFWPALPITTPSATSNQQLQQQQHQQCYSNTKRLQPAAVSGCLSLPIYGFTSVLGFGPLLPFFGNQSQKPLIIIAFYVCQLGAKGLKSIAQIAICIFLVWEALGWRRRSWEIFCVCLYLRCV